MGHYAKVFNRTVIQVIVADADFFNTFIDTSPGLWIQTSYNTRNNVHYLPNSDVPSGKSPLRGNYAGIGYIYDQEHDVFYPPSPYPSWILDRSTWSWKPPVDMPTDGNVYIWDEDLKSWILNQYNET